MRIEHRELPSEHIAVLTLEGIVALTEADAHLFRQTVKDVVDRGFSRLVVDMSKTRLLNTTGLGLLIAGFKTAREQSGDVRLTGADSMVTRILTVTDLIKIFRIFNTVEEALASYGTDL
jgi:anti-sigma B factor antagonist